jgi:probable O-glycosylation ligase (exosortase A-associated)
VINKQLLFMIAATLLGTVGVYTLSPFCGVAVYYLYAVLRPQFIWEWSLPHEVAWSFYVAVPTIVAAVAIKMGVLRNGQRNDGTPFTGAWSTAHWFLLAFAGWVVLTYVTAHSRDAAFPVFQEYLKIFIMFVVSAVLTRTTKQVWILFVVTATVLGYIAYEVNYLYWFYQYLGIYRNGYGGLDNNGAGLMLAMGVPLCYFTWEGMQFRRPWLRWVRWVYLALIPLLIHAVLCTYSRGAMVSMIGTVPFILLWSRRRVFLLGLVAVIVFFVVPVLAGKEIRARFFTIEQHEVDGSAQSRKESWAAAWHIAQDYPLLGVGVRNSPLFTKQYGADMEGRVVHNQFLQIAADNGFPGLALYVGCYLTVFWANFRLRWSLRGRKDPAARQALAVAAGVNCGLVLFCIGAMFLSLEVFELPYLLLLMGAQLTALGRNPALSDLTEGSAAAGAEGERNPPALAEPAAAAPPAWGEEVGGVKVPSESL